MRKDFIKLQGIWKLSTAWKVLQCFCTSRDFGLSDTMEDTTFLWKTGQNFAVTLKIYLCRDGKKKKACSDIPVYIY